MPLCTVEAVGALLYWWKDVVNLCVMQIIRVHTVNNASRVAQYINKAISVQIMDCCAVCLEEGATYACECTAYHASCLSHVLMRSGANLCKICHTKYEPDMLAAASEIAHEKTRDAFGNAHSATRMRKLELASALADVDQAPRAKALFLEILNM